MLSLRKFDFTSKNSYQGCHISKIAQQNLVKHTSLRSIFIKNLYAPNFMDGHSYVPLGQLCGVGRASQTVSRGGGDFWWTSFNQTLRPSDTNNPRAMLKKKGLWPHLTKPLKKNPTSKRQNCRFLTNCHKTMFPRFGGQSDRPTEWPRQKANWPICAIHEYRILSCSFVRNRLCYQTAERRCGSPWNMSCHMIIDWCRSS